MRNTLTRTVIRNLLCAVVFAVGFLSTPTHLVLGDAGTTQPHSPVERMVSAHGRWTGDAPADMQGALPGHVVVTIDGRPRYAGAGMVGKALSQLFEDVDHGLTVHAFCR